MLYNIHRLRFELNPECDDTSLAYYIVLVSWIQIFVSKYNVVYNLFALACLVDVASDAVSPGRFDVTKIKCFIRICVYFNSLT